MYSHVLFVVFVAATIGQSYSMVWKDCSSPPGGLKGVVVVGCETVDVCPIKKGTTAKITFDFMNALSNVTDAKSVVHGVIAHVPVPFDIPNPDPCKVKDSGITCPMKANTEYHYSSVIPVLKSYPSLSLTVKWELQDENGQDIYCAEMPISITD